MVVTKKAPAFTVYACLCFYNTYKRQFVAQRRSLMIKAALYWFMLEKVLWSGIDQYAAVQKSWVTLRFFIFC